MDTKKPQVPREAVELYDSFIHGEINRREFMDGLAKYAVGGLALATLVDALMPNYAAAQQVSKTDERLKSEYVTVPSPNGNGSIKGYLVRPVSVLTNKIPGVIVVHENRGLNPHMEDVARRFALMNFMAFAPDGLTSLGGYPGDDVRGAVNLTAPTPATGSEFARALGHALRRPSLMPVPSFGPKLLLGSELADALLFTGQRVVPNVLTNSGFHFEHDTIEPALKALLAR